MENQTIRIAADYDLCATLIIFITSLAIYITASNIWLAAISGLTLLVSALYSHQSSQFLNAVATTVKADRLKSMSDGFKLMMGVFFVIELFFYGVQHGL